MKQEDKDLLLKDLCARLPYSVSVNYKGEIYSVLGIAHGRLVLCKPFMSQTLEYRPLVEEVKPYLFPLSSMTDEEFKEYEKENDIDTADSSETLRENLKAKKRVRVSKWYRGSEWLNKNHFDYRGLIEKGLAIDASGLNIY